MVDRQVSKDKEKKTRNRNNLIQSYSSSELVSRGFPITLNIESTNLCNLNCIMCPRGEMKRSTGVMESSLFKKVIEESKDYLEFVYLHLFGEPLLNKDIFKMINYAEELGVKVGLSTNVTMLDEENSRKLLESDLSFFVLCLDGAKKETYEKIRKNANFVQNEENIRSFLRIHEKSGSTKPIVTLQMLNMELTKNEMNAFHKEWSKYRNMNIKFKDLCTWADQISEINKLVRRDSNVNPSNRGHCYELWRSLTIYWDGTVVPCCNDYDGKYVLGNVKEEKIEDIWNGEKMVAIRKNHLLQDKTIELCKNCDVPSIGDRECLANVSPFHPFKYELNYYCKNVV